MRNTLVDCAAEGARHGGLEHSSPEQGAERTRQLIAMSLSPRYAADVRAAAVVRDGLRVVEVTVNAPVPVIGLLGAGRGITVRGHGLEEGP